MKNPELRYIAQEIAALEAVFSKQILVFIFDSPTLDDRDERGARLWLEEDTQWLLDAYGCEVHIVCCHHIDSCGDLDTYSSTGSGGSVCRACTPEPVRVD
jgi:hypothetical protein